MGVDLSHKVWDLHHHCQGHDIADCTDALVCPRCSGPMNLHPTAHHSHLKIQSLCCFSMAGDLEITWQEQHWLRHMIIL